MPDPVSGDVVSGQVENTQSRHLLIHENEVMLNHRYPPISNTVPPQVYFLEHRVNHSLKKYLSPLCRQLVILQIYPPQIFVYLHVLLQ